MKKIKRIALLVVAVLVLLVAASGVKTVLDMKNSADNEVQEEDSTRWAELTRTSCSTASGAARPITSPSRAAA